jgi:hypothetical protein
MINIIIELLHTQDENIIVEWSRTEHSHRKGKVMVMIRESKVSNMGDRG